MPRPLAVPGFRFVRDDGNVYVVRTCTADGATIFRYRDPVNQTTQGPVWMSQGCDGREFGGIAVGTRVHWANDENVVGIVAPQLFDDMHPDAGISPSECVPVMWDGAYGTGDYGPTQLIAEIELPEGERPVFLPGEPVTSTTLPGGYDFHVAVTQTNERPGRIEVYNYRMGRRFVRWDRLVRIEASAPATIGPYTAGQRVSIGDNAIGWVAARTPSNDQLAWVIQLGSMRPMEYRLSQLGTLPDAGPIDTIGTRGQFYAGHRVRLASSHWQYGRVLNHYPEGREDWAAPWNVPVQWDDSMGEDVLHSDQLLACGAPNSRLPREREIECMDGVTRHRSEVVFDRYGEPWHIDQAVELGENHYPGTVWAHREDADIVETEVGWYFAVDCTEHNGELVPRHLVADCQCCGNSMLIGELQESGQAMIDGRRYCETCVDRECQDCDNCGALCRSNGSGLCRRCASQDGVYGYGDRSADIMTPESNDERLFGIELEVVARSARAKATHLVRQHLPTDYAVFKRDGSLPDSGFEIVTRPDSLAVHRSKWEQLFAAEPGRLMRSWSSDACGMHVHVTRAALTPLQIGKMLVFLNERNNDAFVSTVAGRGSLRYAQRIPKKISDGRRLSPDRYTPLNITPRTVEFRIFRGNLAREGFLRNLEFVEALIEFCSPAHSSIADAADAGAFCRWLPEHRWPLLHKLLARNGFPVHKSRRKSAKQPEEACV